QKTIAIANEEYGKAVNAFIDGNADLAAIDFQSIVDNYSGQPSALNAAIYLAQIGIKDKNYGEAEENIDKIIKNSDNPQILSSMWALKGNIAYAQGEFENCQKFYENAIKTQPLSAFADEYKVTLAKLYVDQSEFEKAKKLLDDILDNDELRFNIKNDAEDLLAEVSYLLR
ncbi:MAG: tetratricopeptide repeat protein, partial [Fidelibacterota bacterium]